MVGGLWRPAAGPSWGSGVFAASLPGLCPPPVSGRLVPSASLPVSLPLAQAREKEKMKEAKDARYTNGHLFTTISVSGMTMCYACNKSITAKEALICPSKLPGSDSAC